MPAQKRVALYTLGCKVNQEEGAAILGLFEARGWQIVGFEEAAEVYIINTCTVTHLADRKSRQMLRRARRANPRAVIVAAGCYAQVAQAEVSRVEGVDLVVGTTDKARLAELVEAYLKAEPAGAKPLVQVSDVSKARKFVAINPVNPHLVRARANLKIEDGCSQFCSYCIIPYARGPVRSNPLAQVLAQAQELVEAGFLEIVLTGIHTGAYGSDLAEAGDFAHLVKNLAALKGLKRLRLGSIEPLEVTAELIRVVKEYANICPHFHIALQAGCDKTLKAMRRDYTTGYYRELLAKIRENIKDVAITTDMMVGFPGESAGDFQASLEFAREMEFAKIHVFPYSRRKGTPAYDLPGQIAPQVKAQRVKALTQVSLAGEKAFAGKYLGKPVLVLAEHQEKIREKCCYTGHTANYIPVAVTGQVEPGAIIEVVPCQWQNGYLWANC